MPRHNIRNGWSIAPRQVLLLWKVLRPGATYVLLALLGWATKRDVPETSSDFMKCWPTMEMLMAATGLGRRTIQRSIQELHDLGLIRAERRRGNVECSYFYLSGLQARLNELFPPRAPPPPPAVKRDIAEEEESFGEDGFPDFTGGEPDLNFGPPEK